MTKNYAYTIGDKVYMINDPDQNEGVITAVTWWGSRCYSYTVVFVCEGFEVTTLDIREELLSTEKRV
jgi:hypothetical protein